MNRARYTLWLLMLVYTLSFLDRQIISILAEDIKQDLLLSDTQLGVLTGLAFALFYASLGLPIARLAERYSRKNIIAICLGLWSAMTAAAGFAQNFAQMALARVGVGIGEAGSMPASHSMIADMFSPEQRSSAMAIFQLGVPVGILLGFMIGGIVNDWLGWRWTLVVAGVPGLAVAAVVFSTVKEPERLHLNGSVYQNASFFQDLKALWTFHAYRNLLVAATFASMGAYALISWTPAYMIREFGLTTSYVGTVLALINGISGGAGTYLGGVLGDRQAQKHAVGPFRVAAWFNGGAAAFLIMGIASGAQLMTILFLIPGFFLYLAWMGPNWAMVQAIAPPTTRATASAFVLFILNLIGLGLGPLGVGLLSDILSGAGYGNALQLAILASLACFPLAAFFFLRAGKAYLMDFPDRA